jgi:hypothetical protein
MHRKAEEESIAALLATTTTQRGATWAPDGTVIFATGNVATEDLVYLLHGEGVETGIDLEALIDVLGFARLSVSGSSYGGLIAANLALRRRDRVDRPEEIRVEQALPLLGHEELARVEALRIRP